MPELAFDKDPVKSIHQFLNDNSDELSAGEMHLHTCDVAFFIAAHFDELKEIMEKQG